MSDIKKKLVILGAGPAGLALAMKLTQRTGLNADVLILEKNNQVGGLATSFERDGLIFDLGSHRLHPTTSPQIMTELQTLLGEDLLDRPRYGRIRLFSCFVQFPLKPLELLKKLPLSFVFGFLADSIKKPFVKNRAQNSFADVLQKGLGKTICNFFYFPYAVKLWGLHPERIAAVQAQRRVAANSIWKMVAKVLYKFPGFKRPGAGRFFYPRKGFGQISQALALEAVRLGSQIRLDCRIEKIEQHADRRFTISIHDSDPVQADLIFSTIPLTVLTKLVYPVAPLQILRATEGLRFRGMVLHYLVLETNPFTAFDAHYFPEKELIFSRMSEPRNYSHAAEPRGKTGLCFEIPCDVDDTIWSLSEQEMTLRVLADLHRAGLAVSCPVLKSFSVRVPYIYPVYDLNFAENLQVICNFLEQIPNLVNLGRQGLFVHDNTHHTIEMAYRAAECLGNDGVWLKDVWQSHLQTFAQNVVED
jgi:protoporphyrinogen oxidase